MAQKNIFFLIAFFTFLRLMTAYFFGYGVDEAHYVLYTRHLALSYFDHPPLVGWVQYPFSLLGESEFWARVPAILLGAFDSYLVYLLLKDKGEKAAFWGVAALNSSFVLGVLFLTLMPDSLLITLMLLLIFCTHKLENESSFKNYILLGVVFGFLGLSKYTAILFVPAFIIYLLVQKRADLLFNPKIILTTVISLFIISPVLIWNIQNDFASFAFQASHVGGGDDGNFKNFFLSLARQFGSYNPVLFCIAFFGLYAAYKKKEFRLEIILATVVIIFMFVSQYKTVSLPHWISPAFALLIPIGTVYLYDKYSVWTKRVTVFCLFLALTVHLEIVFKIGKFEDFNSPFRDIYGVKEAFAKADDKLGELNSTHKALGITNWSLASRAVIYSKSDVYLTDERSDQFDIWQPSAPTGKDILFVNPKSFYKDINASFACDEVVDMGRHETVLNGAIVDSYSFELCKNFGGIK